MIVKKDGSYNYKFAYSHMASGLVCGFSCVVIQLLSIGCRLCNWNSWRCRHSSKCPARKIICRTYFDTYFWLSTCTVWSHCFPHSCFVNIYIYCYQFYFIISNTFFFNYQIILINKSLTLILIRGSIFITLINLKLLTLTL